MQHGMSLVGLDVHAAQTHAAILDMGTGELRGVKLRMAPAEVVDFLAGLPGSVRAVYEAGPTGFGLARAGVERGIDVRVVAAGKVPRASGDRVKTDKRDAERLARLLVVRLGSLDRECHGSGGDPSAAFEFDQALVAVGSVAVNDVASKRVREGVPVEVVGVVDDELADRQEVALDARLR
jgi:transposase